MDTKTIQNIKAIIIGLALTIGVSYSLAAWTDPASAPTGGNVAAPINVGGGTSGADLYSQVKTGLLTLDHVIVGDLTIPTGAASGKVLTSDNAGKVAWSAAPAATLPANWRQGPPGCNGIITTNSTCYTQTSSGCTGGSCASTYYNCASTASSQNRYMCNTVLVTDPCIAANNCNWGQTTY